jgi:hypothetical protein
MKACTKCKIFKPLDLFILNKRMKDGRGSWCRTCVADQNKLAYKKRMACPEERLKERNRVNTYNYVNKDAKALANKAYAKSNLHVILANNKKAKTAKLKRTPTWLAETDLWMMQEAYKLAQIRTKKFGFVWEVDHIIPLQGRNVSGLHVPLNLQVIPRTFNRVKSNTFKQE